MVSFLLSLSKPRAATGPVVYYRLSASRWLARLTIDIFRDEGSHAGSELALPLSMHQQLALPSAPSVRVCDVVVVSPSGMRLASIALTGLQCSGAPLYSRSDPLAQTTFWSLCSMTFRAGDVTSLNQHHDPFSWAILLAIWSALPEHCSAQSGRVVRFQEGSTGGFSSLQLLTKGYSLRGFALC